MSAESEVAFDVSGLEPGSAIGVQAEGTPIALVNLGGRIHALHDQCTHMKSRLSSGYVEGTNLVCPAHFGSFDIATGAAAARPCRLPVKVFPVREEGTTVWVRMNVVDEVTPQRCSSP